MRLTIDDIQKTLSIEIDSTKKTLPLYSKEAFELISHQWLKIGWNEKYVYTFTWMGRPIIQLPEDMIRIQEVIYRIKPDVIIETGIAHGGSLIYYASICKAMDKGRVIGVDIEIRPHNRTAIESHELYSYITLIEGDATDDKIVNQVKALIKPDETVLVVLDSNHAKQHVLNELNAYSSLVTKGSYIVATDGSMKDLHDVPRGKSEWIWDNPVAAVLEFVDKNPEFVIEQPKWLFNESELTEVITHWPCAYLKRIK
ncbi:MAG: CmcI family methyltransferase [Methanobacteriaceae archaeon]|jgi:cephalosporin hydroxylase